MVSLNAAFSSAVSPVALADPRVGETMGGVCDPAQTAEILAGHEAAWLEHGFGYWIWRDRETASGGSRVELRDN